MMEKTPWDWAQLAAAILGERAGFPVVVVGARQDAEGCIITLKMWPPMERPLLESQDASGQSDAGDTT